MAPPTRDSKGKPIGAMPARLSRERDDGGRGSREDRMKRERRELVDEASGIMDSRGAIPRSMERNSRPKRCRGNIKGNGDGCVRVKQMFSDLSFYLMKKNQPIICSEM